MAVAYYYPVIPFSALYPRAVEYAYKPAPIPSYEAYFIVVPGASFVKLIYDNSVPAAPNAPSDTDNVPLITYPHHVFNDFVSAPVAPNAF